MPTLPSEATSPLDVLASAAALSGLPRGQPPISSARETTPSSVPGLPGLPAIPQKLAKRIVNLDYVDMAELLPEAWHQEDELSSSCCQATKPRRGLLTDITIWTECFATLAAVLTTHYPVYAPQFLAYLRTIVRASRNFEGTAWASYDACYHRQAANRRSLDWSTVDASLYSQAFTGRARIIPRCIHCLRDSHTSRHCAYAPPTTSDNVAHPPLRAGGQAPPRGQSSTPIEVCRLFNKPGGNQCRFRACKYAHICSKCGKGPHLASECGRERIGPRSRSPSPRPRPKTGSR